MAHLFLKFRTNILAFSLGFLSILSQVVLLRELIVVFYGNEMAYAIILGGWLFWVGLGSHLSARFSKAIKNPDRWLKIVSSLLFVMLTFYPLLIRSLKMLLGYRVGEIVGLLPMMISSVLALMPVSILFGVMYMLLCKNFENNSKQHVSSVYLWEGIGATLGGVLFSFLFIQIFTSFQILFLVGCSNFLLVIRPKIRRNRNLLMPVFIVGFCAYLYVYLLPQIDAFSRQLQWRGFDVVTSQDSIYSNITFVKSKGVYSLYENGILSFSTGDALTSEENVHYSLLAHSAPRKILLVGSGLGGTLAECLKYEHLNVDYIELDPKVMHLAKKFLPSSTLAVSKNERVRSFYTDARFFIKTTDERYDLVLFNIADPYTAVLNRYYTVEFFEEAKRLLNEGGLISLSVSSSENYLSEQNRLFLRSINTTLKSVFDAVKSIPGENHIFLAAKDQDHLSVHPDVLVQRLGRRNLDLRYVSENYIPFRLSPDRVKYIEEVLSHDGMLNSDLRPISYYFDMILFSSHFNAGLSRFLLSLQKISFNHILLFLFCLFGFACFLIKRGRDFSVSLSILTTGFSEIIFQILVIVAFQSLYGFAYYKIGLIMASFMAGLVAGTMIARKMIIVFKDSLAGVYMITQIAICLYPFVLPFLFFYFRDAVVNQQQLGVFATVFSLLPFIAGLLGGVQYPLAVEIIAKKRKNQSPSIVAGSLYGFDLFGAFIGAFLTGVLLIPLFGIVQVSLLCGVINAAVLILLWLSRKK